MTKPYRNPFVPTVFGKGYLGDSYGSVPARSPVYRAWKGMLERCFDPSLKIKYPTYIGVTCCDEWLHLTKFKEWFDSNYIPGYELDKDLLIKGNKLYSPNTCCFLPADLNKLLTKSNKARGPYLIGVQFHKRAKKFTSQMNNGQGKVLHLGYFTTELEAHAAYKAAKEKLIQEVADMYLNANRINRTIHNALLKYKVEQHD